MTTANQKEKTPVTTQITMAPVSPQITPTSTKGKNTSLNIDMQLSFDL
jgi:hypothetical protein